MICQTRREHLPKPTQKPKRKHGPSRLEKLLEASIRQELHTKSLYRLIQSLALRITSLEKPP
jgi:hypothetical protein